MSESILDCEIQSLRQEQDAMIQNIRTFVTGKALSRDLYSVEKGLFAGLLALGNLLMKEMITRTGTGKVAEVQDSLGNRLPYHGEKPTTYLSIFGEIEIIRAYYWKENHQGICPLDVRLNLPEHRYSYLLCDWTQNSITSEPFAKAVQRYSEMFGIPVSKFGQQAVARLAGAKFDAFYRKKDPFDEKTEGSHIAIEADGKGVRMIAAEKPELGEVQEQSARRTKGEKSAGLRKMATATADFSFNPLPRSPEEMVAVLMKENKKNRPNTEPVEKVREAKNVTVAASMTNKKTALDSLLERVRKRDPTGAKKIIVLLDGDRALEAQMSSCLQESGMMKNVDAIILDVMHMMDYLWDIGTALHGEYGHERIAWVRKYALKIFHGQIGYVLGGFRQILHKNELKVSQKTAITKAITYFENHKHMMHYDYYLKAGYPIATGIIEGVCGSLIKDRADISGSRWSGIGVQAVLNERAVVKNGDWKPFWNYVMQAEQKRLYGKFIIGNCEISSN